MHTNTQAYATVSIKQHIWDPCGGL